MYAERIFMPTRESMISLKKRRLRRPRLIQV
jgi:hypothetical protein